ncbi:hypothetical protein NW767_000486 [Fusarium falciforme]|nr:hypothetical protein NW767_000486 [Fusarium falciforme]
MPPSVPSAIGVVWSIADLHQDSERASGNASPSKAGNNAPSKLKWLAVNDIGTAVLFEKILRWHILARLTSDCSKLDALAEDLSLCSEGSQ